MDDSDASNGPGSPRGAVPWTSVLAGLRPSAPLVQCLTNTVVQQITANALLAAGAAPAMVDHPDEVEPFAAIAGGVLVNLGTVAPHQVLSMPRAAAAAGAAGVPWVLDPVAVGALPVRTGLARDLVELAPTAIRGNASEVLALAGAGAGGRGVDSAEGSEDAVTAARELAARTGGVVAVSGVRDLVVSADRATWIEGGDAQLTRVTGTGCALGALTAALLAVGRTRRADGALDHDAVIAAHALVGAAGSRAAIDSAGPGSFAVAWLDALGTLDPDDVAAAVELEEI